MGVEAELVVQKSIIPILDVPSSQIDAKSSETTVPEFVSKFRSGSFADIGPRRYMEDEHIRIDDLSPQLGSMGTFPKPIAFYGVFDGHGGPEAAAFVKKNAMKFFFEDANFPQISEEVNDSFLVEVDKCVRNGFILASLALADDIGISSSSGTTALIALVFGRHLMVANAGDSRAVLSRKGQAIQMSQDHKPNYASERKRVEEVGGIIDDGYLHGVLSVTRALGDWDMKLPLGSSSPLIAEPEVRHINLTLDDEFLIIGCDGIWDVMSSQQAVSLVRRGLRKHDDPEQCAKDLVLEALWLSTFDNLTVIIVCFTNISRREPRQQRRLRCCSLSAEALFNNLRSFLD